MLNRSETWKRLLRDPLAAVEIKVDIAGVEYTHKDFVNGTPKTKGGMYDTVGVGNCASRQLDITLFPKGEIPRMAEIRLYMRLVTADEASEWQPQGVYFISTRQENKTTGALTIHTFDAMRKASGVWIAPGEDIGDWPKTEREAVESIAAKMGVEIDERTTLNNVFPIGYPVDETGDMAMADILGGIAFINKGNWVMTDEGKLRLIRQGEEPEETYFMVDEYGDPILLGGVAIYGG